MVAAVDDYVFSEANLLENPCPSPPLALVNVHNAGTDSNFVLLGGPAVEVLWQALLEFLVIGIFSCLCV